MKIRHGYTFDDVLLVPKFSQIKSRSDVNLGSRLHQIQLRTPIVSANMKTVTGPHMAAAIVDRGGLAILHRFSQSRIDDFKMAIELNEGSSENIGISIGIGNSELEVAHQLYDIGAEVFCIDVAHGHHAACMATVSALRKKFDNKITIIAGNVATAAGAKDLHNYGAHVIKAGVGPGSLCTTRIETGNGVPQLSALEDIYLNTGGKVPIIADGGIKTPGDIVKALCFSHAVMLGNMLSGTDEAPGDIIYRNGIQYKSYVGSSTHKTNHIEGVAALSPYKGPVANVIQKIVEGVRSGLSYQGAENLDDLRHAPEFISISNAGLIESKPHDVVLG